MHIDNKYVSRQISCKSGVWRVPSFTTWLDPFFGILFEFFYFIYQRLKLIVTYNRKKRTNGESFPTRQKTSYCPIENQYRSILRSRKSLLLVQHTAKVKESATTCLFFSSLFFLQFRTLCILSFPTERVTRNIWNTCTALIKIKEKKNQILKANRRAQKTGCKESTKNHILYGQFIDIA